MKEKNKNERLKIENDNLINFKKTLNDDLNSTA
jgi:hypothetical protein